MTTNLMPMPKFRAFTKGGAPLVGGKVYTYEAGTNTPLATYTDYVGNTANTNPVILDANGEANIWLAQQQYKIVLRDANDVLQWTVDNVGQNDIADLVAGFGQAIDIASATTVDLGTISTHFANITGTTTITSFGSSAALTAPIYLVKFNGALTITNSSNLITRTGANITTATNDRALVEYLGSGAWRIIDYMRADAAADVGNAVNVLAISNGGTGASTALTAQSSLGLSMVGALNGLTLSNNVSAPNTHIDISAGFAGSDTNGVLMRIASTLTKRLDAAWVAGSGNGGLDTGTRASNTWYYVHVIQNATTNTTDALFSLSATAPTMPIGYTEKRRIGSILTDASSNILAFIQAGDEFWWVTPPTNLNAASSTTATLLTVSVPTAFSTIAMLRGSSLNDGTNAVFRLITNPNTTDVTPSATQINAGAGRAASDMTIAFSMRVRTNSAGQIRHRSSSNTGILLIQTEGWLDTRGRL